MRTWIPLVAALAAFWTGVVLFRPPPGRRDAATRHALGLAAGALCAHLGWWLLHGDRLASAAASLLGPGDAPRVPLPLGACALFVPAGLLLTAPPRRQAAHRARYLAASFAALPPALAVARLGCVFAGCCGGAAHAVPLYEIAALLALTAVVRGAGTAAPPLALAGLGLTRLLLDPLRDAPALDPPWIEPRHVAAALLAIGVLGTARGRTKRRLAHSHRSPYISGSGSNAG